DDLQVREEGSPTAPTIVLLHGFASSLHWWDGVAPELARSYRVVRFDLLGHGGSAKPSGGYTMEHQAQLVDEALARLGIRRALIVGHSMGGVVATALSLRDRPLVAGLVLIDSPVDSHAGGLPFLARLGFLPLIGEATRTLATNGMVQQGLQEAFAPGFRVPHQFVSDFWKMTYTSYDSSHGEAQAYLRRESLDRRLATLGLPVLALYGTRDKLVSPASERHYANVPGARVTAIAGAGHSPMVEKPFAVLEQILAFASRTLR
ncbi:MAG TPA: alpha/beta fold hydrolase, partial [Patescibacteria group bacterium]|nr:alpha/beta fold hydrolase [Patescibacteria group bacterium]